MKVRVHIVHQFTADAPTLLDKLTAGQLEITWGETPPTDYEILIHGRPTAAQLTANASLCAVIVPFAGVPGSTLKLMADYPDISLHNLHHNARATAEMAVTLLLTAAKFVVPVDRELRHNDWTSRYEQRPIATLNGMRALILGYGRIGRHIAAPLQALGMTVTGVRRHASPGDTAEGVPIYGIDALHELLPVSDALICVLPLTEETRGIISAAEFDLLPNDAIVVNVGRGPTIDERAFYAALHGGKLRAAAIDVWYRYPHEESERTDTPPSEYPFHELDNVVMSPHRAGFIGMAETTRLDHLADLLNAAAAGQPIPNEVDRVLGY